MENKNVGILLFGVSIIIIGIIFLFNITMKEIVNETCSLDHNGVICPMYNSIKTQTYLALAITGLLIVVSLILVFSKPDKEIIIKKIKEKIPKKEIDTTGLKKEEKQVLALVRENKAIFQADLIEKTQFGKAKVTRILDRLEGNNFIERKRRGMTNVVVLKE